MTTPSKKPAAGLVLNRRAALLSGAAATLGASALSRATPALAQDASAPATPGSTAFSVEPQPIYSLPHDHRFHGGDFYKKNDFSEWQYFTALGTDTETGEKISMFVCPFRIGWRGDTQSKATPFNFAFSNLDTQEFYSANTLWDGDYTGEATDPDSDDFGFTYRIALGENAFEFSYDHATETWRYAGHCDIDDEFNSPYAFDVTFTVKAPGYIPAAYHGLENIGWDDAGPGYRHNPQTMAGLTRYIQAPRADLTGTVTVGGRTYTVEAEAWYEHQWGNFRYVQQSFYFWGYMRMDDGTAFTWRQYYKDADWGDFDSGMTRFQVIHPDNTVEYGFGPSFRYTADEPWTSPKTGQKYPWRGTMETPLGTFYFTPAFEEQETPSNIPGSAFIEGVGHIHADGPDGPVVGTGFVEMVAIHLIEDQMPFGDLDHDKLYMDFTKVNR